jgi:hypothetical protein
LILVGYDAKMTLESMMASIGGLIVIWAAILFSFSGMILAVKKIGKLFPIEDQEYISEQMIEEKY